MRGCSERGDCASDGRDNDGTRLGTDGARKPRIREFDDGVVCDREDIGAMA